MSGRNPAVLDSLGCLSDLGPSKIEFVDHEGNHLEEILHHAEDEAKSALDRALELEERLAEKQELLVQHTSNMKDELVRQVQQELSQQQVEREQQIVDSFTKMLEVTEAREDALMEEKQSLTRQFTNMTQTNRDLESQLQLVQTRLALCRSKWQELSPDTFIQYDKNHLNQENNGTGDSETESINSVGSGPTLNDALQLVGLFHQSVPIILKHLSAEGIDSFVEVS
jgi:chromosome segregation ATPase